MFRSNQGKAGVAAWLDRTAKQVIDNKLALTGACAYAIDIPRKCTNVRYHEELGPGYWASGMKLSRPVMASEFRHHEIMELTDSRFG